MCNYDDEEKIRFKKNCLSISKKTYFYLFTLLSCVRNIFTILVTFKECAPRVYNNFCLGGLDDIYKYIYINSY